MLFFLQDRARIINPLLIFQCPKVDWIGRKYDASYQQVLEMMLQRDPEKRKDINIICSHPSFARQFRILQTEYTLFCLQNKKAVISSTRKN